MIAESPMASLSPAEWHGLWHRFRGLVKRAGLGGPMALGLALLLAVLLAAPAVRAEEAAPSKEEIGKLVHTLEDDAARARLVAELKTMMAVKDAAKPNQGEASRSASAIRRMSDGIESLAHNAVDLAHGIAALPEAVRWLGTEWTNPARQSVWLSVVWRLAAVIGGGMIAHYLLKFALRTVRRHFEARPRPKPWLRPPLLLAYNTIRLVPPLGFVGAAYGLLALLDPRESARLVAVTAINAHLIASLVKAAGHQGLAPWTPNLRVSGFTDETAAYCSLWWRRLVNLSVYGYFFCQGVLLLGLPVAGYSALTKVLGILVVSLVIGLVLQIRRHVAGWLRAAADRRAIPILALVARRLADSWHILAIGYALAGGIVAATLGLHGFLFFVRASAASFAIVWAAGFTLAATPKLWRNGVRLSAESATRHPGLGVRLARYLPALRSALQVVIVLLAIVLILEAWSLNILSWLASDLGALIVGRIAAIVAIVVIGLVAWELISTLIDGYLERSKDVAERAQRSQRAHTLLPLAKSALKAVIGVVAVLMILAEVGIDIAPILAGVGVVGLAVGFGAQTLVKDVITGVFILLEDTIAVGDVVTAGGQTGTVERFTIRTIQLRDMSGALLTIPFSAIDTITNLTKDYSYFVVDAGVAYREDFDTVARAMREVGAELKADPVHGRDILEPIEVLGLDRFDHSGFIMRARIKTRPARQWAIGREFNRRMKAAFDARGIKVPAPNQTFLFAGGQAFAEEAVIAAAERRPRGTD